MTRSEIQINSDTWVRSDKPTKGYPDGANLRVKSTSWISLMKWKPASARGESAKSSKLYLTQSADYTGTVTVTARRLSAGFNPATVDYDGRPAGIVSGQVPVTKINPPKGTVWEFDVQAFENLWAAGTPAYGIHLFSDSATELLFYSANASIGQPYVVTEHTTAPAKPTRLRPDDGRISKALWVQEGDYVDRSGSTELTAAQVQIDDTSNFSSLLYDTGMVPVESPAIDLAVAAGLMVDNPGAEVDTAGMFGGQGATISRTTAQFSSGVASFAITSDGDGGFQDLITWATTGANGKPCVAGETYTATAKFRAATVGRSCEIRIQWYLADGATAGASAVVTGADTTSAWTTLTVTGEAPPGAVTMLVLARVTGTAAAEVHYRDEVQCARGSVIWLGLAPDQSRYVRMRFMDGDNQWSDWSDGALLTRTLKGSVVITSPSPRADLTNTVRNPSFETNSTSHSNTNGSLTRTQDWAALAGGWSAKHAVTTGGSSTVVSHQGPAIAPNNNRHPAASGDKISYRLTLRTIRAIAVRLNILQYDAAGAAVGSLLGTTVTLEAGKTYTMERLNVVLSGVGVAAYVPELRLYEPGSSVTPVAVSGDTFYVDHLAAVNSGTEDLDEVPYFDGDTPNTAYITTWSGTVHASSSIRQLVAVDEFTPPITWTYTPPAGASQTHYQILVAPIDRPTAYVYNSEKVKSTASSATIPKGKLADGRQYVVTVRIWDSYTDRVDSVGDPVYVSAVTAFLVTYSASVTPPTSLTATQSGITPWVDLLIGMSAVPDSLTIRRDGVAIDTDLLPSELEFVSTGLWRYRDWTARPSVPHTYVAHRETNGVLSKSSPAATITPKAIGVWLGDPDAGLEVILGGRELTGSRVDQAESMSVIGGIDPIRSIAGLGGLAGTAGPLLLRDRDGYDWLTLENALYNMIGRPAETYRLVWGDQNIPVLLGDVTILPATEITMHDRVIKSVTFNWSQYGEHPFAQGA